MKKIVFVFLLSILLVSCKKYEEIPENPAWLNEMIAQMETNDLYIGKTVYLYKWHGDYYYRIVLHLSSSYYTNHIYNYDGTKLEWTKEKEKVFLHYGKMIKIVWQRVYTTYASE